VPIVPPACFVSRLLEHRLYVEVYLTKCNHLSVSGLQPRLKTLNMHRLALCVRDGHGGVVSLAGGGVPLLIGNIFDTHLC
jgi:hypothetical protein